MGQTKQRSRSLLQCSLLLILVVVGGGWLMAPALTIRGVPLPIIIQFLMDEPARDAYYSGNATALHDRLNDLDIEAKMKAFYRPQIRDEVKLDQHIHQIFYDTTGYVGNAYRLNQQGILVLKTPSDTEFKQWFQLASQAGIVVDSKKLDGVQYVISPEGITAPYRQIAALYPKSLLRQLITVKQRL